MKEESSDDPKSSSDEKNRDEKDTKGKLIGVRSKNWTKMDGQAKIDGEPSTFIRFAIFVLDRFRPGFDFFFHFQNLQK